MVMLEDSFYHKCFYREINMWRLMAGKVVTMNLSKNSNLSSHTHTHMLVIKLLSIICTNKMIDAMNDVKTT